MRRPAVTVVRQPPRAKSAAGSYSGLPGPDGPARKPCPRPDGFQPWTSEVRAQETRGATQRRAFLRKNTKFPQPAIMPQSPHSQPGTLRAGPSLTVRPRLAILAMQGRHGPESSDSAPTSPKLEAGAETGTTQKPIRGSRRPRTSARKSTDLPRSAAPHPRPSRGRAFWRPVTDPLGKRASGGGAAGGS